MTPLLVIDGLSLPEGALSWSAVRASGPGGQNVNKVASKVVLRLDLDACPALGPAVRLRIVELFGARLDAEGRLSVSSQRTRDQARNLADARDKLRAMIARALERPTPRRATRPTRASNERRLDAKRRGAARRSQRRPERD